MLVSRPSADAEERFLRLSDVEALVGFKSSKIYQLIQDGDFPAPLRLSERTVRWRLTAVRTWMNEQIARCA
jgi:prophage regulatory protein